MNKTIGVLGGGQLGRMLAESANRLNIKLVALDKPAAPAKQITAHGAHVDGSFKDPASIRALASAVDVLTIEIEHVDAVVLAEVEAAGTPVHPAPSTIRLIQDKFEQKRHLRAAGIAVPDFVGLESNSMEELARVGDLLGYPYMLKSRKEAYDGRGNFPVSSRDSIPAAQAALAGRPLYAERWCPFECELAVIVVQTSTDTLTYPAVETVHADSICKLVYAPARNISTATAAAASALARRAVASFSGRGIFAVELFLQPSGDLLVNEIAPRPHNSGHWTIEACPLSQFDAHLRAVLDLPLPPSSLLPREPAIMLNILGGAASGAHLALVDAALATPRCSVHLYGKGPGTPGRKMGHITLTAPSMSEASALMAPLVHVADQIAARVGADVPPPLAAPAPLVAVIMGSDSDLPTLAPCLDLLEKLDIPADAHVTSAHRTPAEMASFASRAAQRGYKVIIAAAGGAAHLPGMAAAYTPLPVIGVPVKGSSTDGMDSLLSIVQMPRGVPVATVAIGNGVNAALLAARILGVHDVRVRERVERYASEAHAEVRGKEGRLEGMGWREYLQGMKK